MADNPHFIWMDGVYDASIRFCLMRQLNLAHCKYSCSVLFLLLGSCYGYVTWYASMTRVLLGMGPGTGGPRLVQFRFADLMVFWNVSLVL